VVASCRRIPFMRQLFGAMVKQAVTWVHAAFKD
jgi:hypothetical protein